MTYTSFAVCVISGGAPSRNSVPAYLLPNIGRSTKSDLTKVVGEVESAEQMRLSGADAEKLKSQLNRFSSAVNFVVSDPRQVTFGPMVR